MPASDDLRDGMGEAFDALAAEFENGVVVTLLKVPEVDSLVIAGAGTSTANGTVQYDGELNSKPSYVYTVGDDPQVEGCYWDVTLTDQWVIGTNADYFSTDDVDYPWQVTTWQADNGTLPVPTVTRSNAFADVLTISTKRFWEYSNFRKNTLLEIGDTSAAITAAMAEATHVSIDDDIYTIIAGDTLPPSGTLPVWRIYLDLFERRDHYTRL